MYNELQKFLDNNNRQAKNMSMFTILIPKLQHSRTYAGVMELNQNIYQRNIDGKLTI